MARPKKDKNLLVDQIVEFGVTVEQFAKLQRVVKLKGIPATEYLRNIVLPQVEMDLASEKLGATLTPEAAEASASALDLVGALLNQALLQVSQRLRPVEKLPPKE